MNRQQKEAIVSNFQDMFTQAEAAFLVNYKGVNVADLQHLRKQLRRNDAILKITKARLMKIATKDLKGVDNFEQNLKDQVGIIFAMGHIPAAAKEIVTFSKNLEAFQIVSGYFEQKVITEQDIRFLAALPSREVVLGQVAATLQAPIASLARILNLLVKKLLYTLQQASQKK